MASEHWSEGDERAAREAAEALCADANDTLALVNGGTILADRLRGAAYTAIRTAVLAERARWRGVGEGLAALEHMIGGLEDEIAQARAQREQRGGQQVTPCGDFVSAPPSTLVALTRWARHFREALASAMAAVKGEP